MYNNTYSIETRYIGTPQYSSLQEKYENICIAGQDTGHSARNIRHAWRVSKAKNG